MYTRTNEKYFKQFVKDNDKYIDDIVLMHTKPLGFANEYVGNEYLLQFKIVTIEGYRNKFIEFVINDSYLDCDEVETAEDYADNLVCALLIE